MIDVVYKPYILNSLTGNTNSFINSNILIEPNISINSGITLDITKFDRHTITKIDIINNLVNYIDDINKYMLEFLIVDSGLTYTEIIYIGNYCIKLSYENEVINYFLLNVYDLYVKINYNNTSNISNTLNDIIIKSPKIYYNSNLSWSGGNEFLPYNVFLHLIHDNITGWTVNTLLELFILELKDSNGVDMPIYDINLMI